MDLGNPWVELADKFAPRLQPLVALHQADNLGIFAEALKEGAHVPVDGLTVRKQKNNQIGTVQRIFLLSSPHQGLADLVVVHRHPGDEPLAPSAERRTVFQLFGVQALIFINDATVPAT